MKQRINIRPAGTADLDEIEKLCSFDPGPGINVKNLSPIALSGCLLQSRRRGRLLGVVGLDLNRGAIAGPWIAQGAGSLDVGRKLLAAAERLAIQFGMTQLVAYPAKNARSFFAENGYLKTAGERAGHAGLSRSIIRRTTRFARHIREISAELGIPRDYGSRHQLRLQPEANRLRSIGHDIYGREQKMSANAARSWKRMIKQALSDGIDLQPVSAFRTVEYQAGLVRRKLEKGQVIADILKVSAAPGYSEHHSGRAIDITTPGSEVLEEPFEGTTAFEWLANNAGGFNFSLSYPRNNRHGIAYEPWHWAWKAGQQ